jgi:hypothetical protein
MFNCEQCVHVRTQELLACDHVFFSIRKQNENEIAHPLVKMKEAGMSMLNEQYRVVAVESDRLLLRGIPSREVLTIINPKLETTVHSEPARYPRLPTIAADNLMVFFVIVAFTTKVDSASEYGDQASRV